jgi:hypothetical protein
MQIGGRGLCLIKESGALRSLFAWCSCSSRRWQNFYIFKYTGISRAESAFVFGWRLPLDSLSLWQLELLPCR